jgi:hypothetical protein
VAAISAVALARPTRVNCQNSRPQVDYASVIERLRAIRHRKEAAERTHASDLK